MPPSETRPAFNSNNPIDMFPWREETEQSLFLHHIFISSSFHFSRLSLMCFLSPSCASVVVPSPSTTLPFHHPIVYSHNPFFTSFLVFALPPSPFYHTFPLAPHHFIPLPLPLSLSSNPLFSNPNPFSSPPPSLLYSIDPLWKTSISAAGGTQLSQERRSIGAELQGSQGGTRARKAPSVITQPFIGLPSIVDNKIYWYLIEITE